MRKVILGLVAATALTSVAFAATTTTPSTAPATDAAKTEATKTEATKTETTAESKEKKAGEDLTTAAPAAGEAKKAH